MQTLPERLEKFKLHSVMNNQFSMSVRWSDFNAVVTVVTDRSVEVADTRPLSPLRHRPFRMVHVRLELQFRRKFDSLYIHHL